MGLVGAPDEMGAFEPGGAAYADARSAHAGIPQSRQDGQFRWALWACAVGLGVPRRLVAASGLSVLRCGAAGHTPSGCGGRLR